MTMFGKKYAPAGDECDSGDQAPARSQDILGILGLKLNPDHGILENNILGLIISFLPKGSLSPQIWLNFWILRTAFAI